MAAPTETAPGWSSNLLDIAATPLFLLAVAALGRRATNRPATVGAVTAATQHPPRARAGMSAIVGAGLVAVVALGAAHDGGVTAPAHAGAKGDRHAHAIVAAPAAARVAPHGWDQPTR